MHRKLDCKSAVKACRNILLKLVKENMKFFRKEKNINMELKEHISVEMAMLANEP